MLKRTVACGTNWRRLFEAHKQSWVSSATVILVRNWAFWLNRWECMFTFMILKTNCPLGNATQVQHLSDLLNMSDVVSLHVPENPSTKNMMGAKEISLMKPGSLLINASRGCGGYSGAV